MKYFATLFDYHYLSRGLALYQSMQMHIEEFTLYVLALDEAVVQYFKHKNHHSVEVIPLEFLEIKYPELLSAKKNRTTVEYYFTLSPVLPLYLLESNPQIEYITTLDSDIYFFSNPQSLFEQFRKYSIMITAHDFSEPIMHWEKYGKYNLSFQSFRRDAEGLTCLTKWKEQCLEWCYDRMEGERFADQKYLDNWTDQFKNVLVVQGKGAGIAPWNISKYSLTQKSGHTFCDEHPLIFYHFQGLRVISKNCIRHGLHLARVRSTGPMRKYVYASYIESLIQIRKNKIKRESEVLRFKPPKYFLQLIELLLKPSRFYFFHEVHLFKRRFRILL